MHFTGKQRDTETNLDDFPARYYSSVQGRCLSPDWDTKPVSVPYAILGNPQTLNLYSYVGGDPTNHADADGHMNFCPECMESADSSSEAGNQGSGEPGDRAQNTTPAQISSLQFLGQELKGVYDVTAGPVVDAATHPVQTVENAASNLVEGVKDVANDPKGTLTGAAEGAKDLAVQFGSQVASGDPRSIGHSVGVAATAAYTAENVRVGSYEHGGGGANLKNTPLNGNRITFLGGAWNLKTTIRRCCN
jgi:RHS repeat-associated protein